MDFLNKQQNRIGWNLVQKLRWYGVLFAIIASFVQVQIAYNKSNRDLENSIVVTLNQIEAPMAAAIWSFDQSQIDAIINGALKSNDIVGISILDLNKKTLADSWSKQRDNLVFKKSFPIKYKNNMTDKEVATINIYVTRYNLYMNLIGIFAIVLFSNFLITTLVCIGVLYMVDEALIQPLLTLRGHVNTFENTREIRDLNFRHTQSERDELDDLADAIKSIEASVVKYISDLSDTNMHLEEKIKQKTLTINSNLSERNQLLQMLTHDLANPLMVLERSSLMLKKESEDLKRIKLEGKMQRSIDVMKQITSQVKELLAIEAGKKTIELEDFYLRPALRKCLYLFEDSAKLKQVNINLKCDLDIIVNANENIFLNQVMSNLISNALKFTPEGKNIFIEVSKLDQMISVQIRDEGIGMPKYLIENLFNTSYSTSRLGTSGEKGTGFGMSIVKKYVEAMCGSISVDSVENTEDSSHKSGTTFTILIGCKKAMAA